MIRFHLDENVNHGIAAGLRQRGVDVTTSTDAELISADDEDQLDFAKRNGRVLLTHDSDFLSQSLCARSHAGIVYSPKDKRSIGETVRYLALICEVLEAAEMTGRVEYF